MTERIAVSSIIESMKNWKKPLTDSSLDGIRAVFFDIDDTLYDHAIDAIPSGTLEAIRRLKEKGIRVALSTARSLQLAELLIGETMDLWDGVVAGNGAYVYDENRQVLFEKTIPAETLDRMTEITERHGGGVFASGSCAITFDDLPCIQAKLDSVHVSGLPVRRPGKNDRFSVLSLCHPHPEELREELEQVEGMFLQYTPYSYDVSRDDLSKFEGIEFLMRRWHLPSHAYAAFGDSQNDLEMLENAAVSIAPAASHPRVLELADHVAPPTLQGGLAAWMKQAGWLE